MPTAACEVEPHEIRIAQTRTRVLSISPELEDHCVLRRWLHESWWDISVANGSREAAVQLASNPVDIIVSERDLPDGSWKDVLRYLDERSERPVLIVTSRAADPHLWAEVLNLGGYDVLAKPFDNQEVCRVLGYARCRQDATAALEGAA